ncbi:MAG TPA: collagenase [Microscillaceae bacterium]|nr:collagenase [Microscillaceae bacterium]
MNTQLYQKIRGNSCSFIGHLFTTLLVLLLIVPSQGRAQHKQHSPKCSHLHMHQHLLQRSNPALRKQMEDAHQLLEQQTRRFARQRITQTTYTIPVVFHVVHDGGVENISDAQIIDAVAQMNEDFSAQNPGVANVANAFKGIVANVGFQFALAQKDPNGNPTTGITRTRSALTTNGRQLALKQLIRWPREKYLNIWVVRSSDGGNGSAFAFYPGDTEGTNEIYDGVVSSHWAVGRTGTAVATHYKILTHEVGHWANLKHTWGDQSNNGDANGCSFDDGVADTPNTIGNTGCNLTGTSCGSLDNTQNYMDYGNCTVMFTEGQKTRMLAAMNSNVGERSNIWSAANLAATLYSAPTPRLVFAKTTFAEGIGNNGSIDEKIGISLLDGATFSASSGNLSPSQFSVSGLPTGLSAQVTILSSTSAEISLNGNAGSHAQANSVNNISITFNSSAFAVNVSNPTTAGVGIDFINPYTIIYQDIADIQVTPSATWTFFSLGAGNADYGVFYNTSNTSFHLEAYQKDAVCAAGTRNLTPLAFNTSIGPSSQWEAGGAFPDLHNVTNATYTIWNGQTAYVGVRFTNAGNTHYGWLKLEVAADGQSYKLLEHAYHEQPNASIRAGQTLLDSGNLAVSKTSVKEDVANNGTINETITLSLLNGASFTTGSGNLTAGTHFNATNVPAGLTAQVTVTSSTTATLSFTGVATNHEVANDVSNVKVTLLASAISGSSNLATPDLSINFINVYTIVYQDVDPDSEVTTTAVWTAFNLGLGDATRYGIFYNAEKTSFQLEAYEKDAVCAAGTRNLTPLTVNTIIGPASQWEAGGAYPDLHDVTNASYTAWNGQTAYVGVRFTNAGNTHYGWLKLQVAADGQSYKLLEHAYHEKPNEPIKAGQTSIGTTPTPPVAAFTANVTTITVGQSVTFTDQSTNTPTSWNWTFAGGMPANSVVQNPVVTYNTPGTYDVILTATNADGSNTLTKTAYITVNPATCSYCAASSNRSSYEHIAGVKVGNFNNTSGAANYTDFTSQTIDLNAGENNVIELTPGFSGSSYNEYFRVWIDYNGDCDFDDAGELVYTSGSTTTTVSGTIAVPAGLEITTRMRIAMKYNGAAANACGNFADGEVEDYTVNIVTGVITPPTPEYCAATAQQTGSEHITQVQIGSINNSSASSGYGDYTSQSTNVTTGQNYNITVTPSASWSSSKLSIWVDWNRDGDFKDSGEATVLNGAGPYNTNLTVPAGATTGATRMRIRLSYGNSLSTACGNGWTGEVEDYTLVVSANGAQAGARMSNSDEGARVFPNPSVDGVYTILTPPNRNVTQSIIRVFNSQGRLVRSERVNGSNAKLNLKGLPKGIYQMQMIQNNKSYHKTLIYQ